MSLRAGRHLTPQLVLGFVGDVVDALAVNVFLQGGLRLSEGNRLSAPYMVMYVAHAQLHAVIAYLPRDRGPVPTLIPLSPHSPPCARRYTYSHHTILFYLSSAI